MTDYEKALEEIFNINNLKITNIKLIQSFGAAYPNNYEFDFYITINDYFVIHRQNCGNYEISLDDDFTVAGAWNAQDQAVERYGQFGIELDKVVESLNCEEIIKLMLFDKMQRIYFLVAMKKKEIAKHYKKGK
jgi:hypothetical protein